MIFQMQKTLKGVQSTTCRVRIFFLLNLIVNSIAYQASIRAFCTLKIMQSPIYSYICICTILSLLEQRAPLTKDFWSVVVQRERNSFQFSMRISLTNSVVCPAGWPIFLKIEYYIYLYE